MTEQTKQKLKDALIEHKNIASSEYYDEDAFVGIYFCDLVDIIDGIMQNTGWQPDRVYPPTYVTPCYAPNGICTNPQMDCINCPKRGTGGTWSTSTNIKTED